jgi:hypothetical protein
MLQPGSANNDGSARRRVSPFRRSWHALEEWLAHTLLIIGIILCIALIHKVLTLLLGGPNPSFSEFCLYHGSSMLRIFWFWWDCNIMACEPQ